MKAASKPFVRTLGRLLASALALALLSILLRDSSSPSLRAPLGSAQVTPIPQSLLPGDMLVLKQDALSILVTDEASSTTLGWAERPSMMHLLVLDAQDDMQIVTLPDVTRAPVARLDAQGSTISTRYEPLDMAYARGKAAGLAHENLLSSTSALFGGIPLAHYVTLSTQDIPALIDAVGGILVPSCPYSLRAGAQSVADSPYVGYEARLTGAQAMNYVASSTSVNRVVDLGALGREQNVLLGLIRALGDHPDILQDTPLKHNLLPEHWARLGQSIRQSPTPDMHLLWGENRVIAGEGTFLPDMVRIKAYVLATYYTDAPQARVP